MISANEWWGVLTSYNSTIFPMQFVVMGILFTLLLLFYLNPCKTTNILLKAFLALTNAGTGIAFFIVIGTKLPSPLRFIQGGLFVAIGISFVIDIFTNTTVFSLPTSKKNRVITLFLFILVLAYPLIGLLRGHTPMQLIYPGTVPCATVSLSLVLLSASLPKVNKFSYVLLLIWAIPFAPLVQIPKFKVYEDAIMFLIGIYSAIRFAQSLQSASNCNKK